MSVSPYSFYSALIGAIVRMTDLLTIFGQGGAWLWESSDLHLCNLARANPIERVERANEGYGAVVPISGPALTLYR